MAVGITSKIAGNNNQLIGSAILINGREYFDFKLSVDILVKSNGISGVVFRYKDQYNFYAFYVDKSAGKKVLSLVEDGKLKVLKEIRDGGILVNDWHRVEILASAGSFNIFMYDVEQPTKAKTEKVIEYSDFTYSSGFVGLFVNGMEGFFFDNLSVNPAKCWTPWTPMKNLNVAVPLSQVHIEDFSGTLTEKFTIVEPEISIDGPSEWIMNQFAVTNAPSGLYMKNTAYDKSSSRRPNIIIKNDKYLSNGNLSISFRPFSKEGVVSIVFKYERIGDSEQFYLFDFVHSEQNPQFVLRKYSNGVMKEINSVNAVTKDIPMLGYKLNTLHQVKVEVYGESIKVKVSINNAPYAEVMNVKDSSIVSGLVGVGTYKTKCNFSSFELFPPFLQMTDEEKNTVLSTDSEDIFLYPRPNTGNVDNEINKLKQSITSKLADALGKNKKGGDKSKDVSGLSIKDPKGDAGDAFGWKTCAITNSIIDRKSLCERSFSHKTFVKKCEVNIVFNF